MWCVVVLLYAQTCARLTYDDARRILIWLLSQVLNFGDFLNQKETFVTSHLCLEYLKTLTISLVNRISQKYYHLDSLG
jgi:hypothetical protein